jgi:hypothetical protein
VLLLLLLLLPKTYCPVPRAGAQELAITSNSQAYHSPLVAIYGAVQFTACIEARNKPDVHGAVFHASSEKTSTIGSAKITAAYSQRRDSVTTCNNNVSDAVTAWQFQHPNNGLASISPGGEQGNKPWATTCCHLHFNWGGVALLLLLLLLCRPRGRGWNSNFNPVNNLSWCTERP